MLPPLFIGQTVGIIADALASADDRGLVAILGQARVARAVAERGVRVITLAERRGSLRRVKGTCTYSRLDLLPLADHKLAGLVAFGVGQRDDWSQTLTEWCRVVAGGGVVVLVDRAPATELTRRALCSGLVDIGQRHAGRTIVTTGRIARFSPALRHSAAHA